MVHISVLLATCGRTDLLSQTLGSFCKLKEGSLSWEILVVDNADDHQTREMVGEFSAKLPVHYLLEKKRGKNNALNSAIHIAQGQICLFTDDDILADSQWLVETWAGINRWPHHAVFGGRILPKFPSGRVPLKPDHPFFEHAYAAADWDIEEGPYSAHKVWGPNMAIRSEVFRKGVLFNEKFGVDGTNYVTGGETELTLRLEREGVKPIYLPKSLVLHQIRPEQLQRQWLCRRAFTYGRYAAELRGHRNVPYLFGAPRRLFKRLLITYWQIILSKFDDDKKLNMTLRYWKLRGMIFQYRAGLFNIR